uniref:Ycf1 n=1 Tax=Rhizophora mucronata TaxID=61149 RepID=A0A2P2M2A2_RHIMU
MIEGEKKSLILPWGEPCIKGSYILGKYSFLVLLLHNLIFFSSVFIGKNPLSKIVFTLFINSLLRFLFFCLLLK